MEAPRIRNFQSGPEAKIQAEIIKFLRAREWYVRETHGNAFQSGFPDLYCSHHAYGCRWIEVKNPANYSFTPAQLREFPLMTAHGTRIWILVAATEEEYKKLWKPPNWHLYLSLMNPRGSK